MSRQLLCQSEASHLDPSCFLLPDLYLCHALQNCNAKQQQLKTTPEVNVGAAVGVEAHVQTEHVRGRRNSLPACGIEHAASVSRSAPAIEHRLAAGHLVQDSVPHEMQQTTAVQKRHAAINKAENQRSVPGQAHKTTAVQDRHALSDQEHNEVTIPGHVQQISGTQHRHASADKADEASPFAEASANASADADAVGVDTVPGAAAVTGECVRLTAWPELSACTCTPCPFPAS